MQSYVHWLFSSYSYFWTSCPHLWTIFHILIMTSSNCLFSLNVYSLFTESKATEKKNVQDVHHAYEYSHTEKSLCCNFAQGSTEVLQHATKLAKPMQILDNGFWIYGHCSDWYTLKSYIADTCTKHFQVLIKSETYKQPSRRASWSDESCSNAEWKIRGLNRDWTFLSIIM